MIELWRTVRAKTDIVLSLHKIGIEVNYSTLHAVLGRVLWERAAGILPYVPNNPPITPPNAITNQPKKRRRLIWGVAAVIALVFAWGIVNLIQSSRLPFSDNNEVLASLPWAERSFDGTIVNPDNYLWLDNETIIYLVPIGYQTWQLMRQRVKVGQSFPAEPIPNIKPLILPVLRGVSPNGKSLVIYDREQSYKPRLAVYSLEGSGLRQQYETYDGFVTWLADSRHFLC